MLVPLPIWETQMGFQGLGFGLAQFQLLWAFKV